MPVIHLKDIINTSNINDNTPYILYNNKYTQISEPNPTLLQFGEINQIISTNYLISQNPLLVKFKANTVYTFLIYGSLGTNKTHFSIYGDIDKTIHICDIYKSDYTGSRYQKTITTPDNIDITNIQTIYVYVEPENITSSTYIKYIRIVQGVLDLARDINHDYQSDLWYSSGKYAINLNNSDIINANAIYFQDGASSFDEGLFFKDDRQNNTSIFHGLRINGYGTIEYIKNRDFNKNTKSNGTTYEIYHSGNTSNVFIAYHRSIKNNMLVNDNYPLYTEVQNWPDLEKSGEIADGVLIIEGDKHLLISTTEPEILKWSWTANPPLCDTSINTITESLNDFNGQQHCQKIVDIGLAANSPTVISSAYAPGYCYLYKTENINGVGISAGKWWLPSIGELNLISAHLIEVNNALKLITGAQTIKADLPYWSSTESSATHAFDFNFGNRYIGVHVAKNATLLRCRPVTYFGY